MKPLSLVTRNSALKILCLGAHSDDIEIGCGGTILKLIRDHHGDVAVRWVVFSSSAERQSEAAGSAAAFLKNAKQTELTFGKFEDSYFPYQGSDIKKYMHQLSREFAPDMIFTHYGKDLHQDHRLLSELTWNAFRDHWILEYEIPKYDGDLGSPNVFVPLDRVDLPKQNQLSSDSLQIPTSASMVYGGRVSLDFNAAWHRVQLRKRIR